MRESINKFEDRIAEQEQRLNEAIIGFEKRVNDHQSEVLWRIQDCEELLKNRVSEQRVRDITTTIDDKLTGLLHAEQEKLKELIEKASKDLILHVRQTENLTSEKFDFIKDLLMKVDQKAGQMATTDMIDTLKEDNKNLKSKFEMEFEQF